MLSLKSSDHFFKIVKELFDDDNSADIIFITKTSRISAHSFILLSQVPSLSSLVCDDCRHAHDNTVVIIPDIEAEIVDEALTELYINADPAKLNFVLNANSVEEEHTDTAVSKVTNDNSQPGYHVESVQREQNELQVENTHDQLVSELNVCDGLMSQDDGNNKNDIKSESNSADDSDSVQDCQEDKINILLDLFKTKDPVTLSKYIKVFNQNDNHILGIAHAKLNNDFNKIFKKLGIKSDDDDTKHVKSFTKPSSEKLSGRSTMITTYCKIFYIERFSRKFQKTIFSLFGFNEEAVNVEENIFPTINSDNKGSLKACTICSSNTETYEKYEEHMLGHTQCMRCGLYFLNETDFQKHTQSFHASRTCEECGKVVLGSQFFKHSTSHQVIQSVKRRVGSKNKTKNTGNAPKHKKSTSSAYKYFLTQMRPYYKNENPDASPQEILKILNIAWKKEKNEGKKKYWDYSVAVIKDRT